MPKMPRCLGDCLRCRRCLRDGLMILRDARLPALELDPPAGTGGGLYGLAADIGTTTVVAYLFELATGAPAGAIALPNAQRRFGGDVISRLRYCADHGHSDLTLAINSQLSFIEGELLKNAGGGEIADRVVAGNTIMQHLHAGLDPSGMAAVPFTPASLFGKTINGTYYCPCVSPFVGGDITAGLLAARHNGFSSGHFFLDIGTNGEMAFQAGEKIYTAATAAGPAFEGGEISCGSPACTGAIDHVFLEGGKLSFTLIPSPGDENPAPCGICGTGLIDLLACLLKLGIIEPSGYMEEPFTLCGGVVLLPEDVRKLQLAKGAIAAGRRTLLSGEGMPRLEKLHLAGGFASYTRLDSAREIGLLPEGAEIENEGHAAGAGACLALLSKRERASLEEICRSCETVELSANARFAEFFMEEMAFDA